MAEERQTDAGNFPEPIPGLPPQEELGDAAFPMFPYAKVFKTNPAEIAAAVAPLVQEISGCRTEAAGAYVNLFYNLPDLARLKIPISEKPMEEKESGS